MDYDWEPHPCAVYSSFSHEEGLCSTTMSTLAAMEITAPATCGLVQGEAVAAPGGTSISLSPVTEPQVVQLQSPSMEVAPPTSKDHLLQQTPDQHKGVSETSSSSSMEKRQVDVDSTSKATKTKYRTTPHAKKGVSSTPPKDLNQFSALHASDEEVETLIAKAQQSRKTVHLRLLRVSGKEIEPGGFWEVTPDNPPQC